MKIGEFQKFYNIFFGELIYCNILEIKQLRNSPGFRSNFVQRLCEVQAFITRPVFGGYGFCFIGF